MKKEYDFSKGVKGKFYIPEKDIELPVYLDKENLEYFINLSRSKKIAMSKLVNKVLSKDRELIDFVK
ncbi:MAG TPA: hypothetical protein PKG60_11880 [Spirochaetota bacterium]|nr:hypothetical protein [Spirochaetota bacterium]